MPMLANRSPAGFCLCKLCVKPDERREIRKRNRLREEREWRADAWAHHPDQEPVEDDEWYARIDAEADPNYELPPGFDGSWSIGPSN